MILICFYLIPYIRLWKLRSDHCRERWACLKPDRNIFNFCLYINYIVLVPFYYRLFDPKTGIHPSHRSLKASSSPFDPTTKKGRCMCIKQSLFPHCLVSLACNAFVVRYNSLIFSRMRSSSMISTSFMMPGWKIQK